MLGTLLLAGLMVVYVAGPQLSPKNPFLTKGLDFVDGELFSPPFAP